VAIVVLLLRRRVAQAEGEVELETPSSGRDGAATRRALSLAIASRWSVPELMLYRRNIASVLWPVMDMITVSGFGLSCYERAPLGGESGARTGREWDRTGYNGRAGGGGGGGLNPRRSL
jgi:hypothetical protein